MKKIMIAFSVALCAVAVNAATVSWNSGTFRRATSSDGGWAASGGVRNYYANGTSLMASLFLVDETTYAAAAKMSASELYSTYVAKETTATASSTGNNVAVTTSASTGQDYYAVVIYSYTDATYGEMHIAATASIKGSLIDNAANTYNVGNIGSTAGAASGWQSIPEPTGAMLLVLGVAALGLRRKRA